jgi:hypothetical protein
MFWKLSAHSDIFYWLYIIQNIVSFKTFLNILQLFYNYNCAIFLLFAIFQIIFINTEECGINHIISKNIFKLRIVYFLCCSWKSIKSINLEEFMNLKNYNVWLLWSFDVINEMKPQENVWWIIRSYECGEICFLIEILYMFNFSIKFMANFPKRTSNIIYV